MMLTIERLQEILQKPGYVYSGMSPVDLVNDTEKGEAAVRAIVARYPAKERAAVAEQIAELAVDAAQKGRRPFAAKPPKAQSAAETITELGGFRIGERVRVLESSLYEGHEGEICSFSPPAKVFLQLDGIKPPCGFSIANIEPVEPVGAPEAWGMVATETSEPVQLSLFDLIELINSEHQKCEQAFGEMLLHAKKTGEYLTQAKAMVPHGGWLDWVKENCKFTERTARRYVQVFSSWEELQERRNRTCMSDLSLNQALALLAGENRQYQPEDIFEGDLLPAAEPEAPDQVSPGSEPETPEKTIPAESNPRFLPGDSIKVIDSPGRKELIGKEGYVVQMLPNGTPLLRITGEQYEVSLPANCCELIKGSASRPPAPEPVKPEEVWPMRYRQRVKLVDAPKNCDHWQTLIGREGYVVKCSRQKNGDWTVTVKIDEEKWPVVVPLNCWEELYYEPKAQIPAATLDTAADPAQSPQATPKPPIMARAGSDVYLTPEKLWRPALVAWEKEQYDLDPASNDRVNPNIPASWYFLQEDDGLQSDWKSCQGKPCELLWCNPPFSLMAEFVDKLISELEMGNVNHAVFLAKCDCRTQWFEELSVNCNAVCFVHEAVQFVGQPDSSFFGVCLFYFGDNPGLFYRSHQHLGTVMQAMIPGMFGE